MPKYIFLDSFDHYSAPIVKWDQANLASIIHDPGVSRTGPKCLRILPQGFCQLNTEHTDEPNTNKGQVGFGVRFDQTPSAEVLLMRFTGVQIVLELKWNPITTEVSLSVFDNGSFQEAHSLTPTIDIADGNWHFVEVGYEGWLTPRWNWAIDGGAGGSGFSNPAAAQFSYPFSSVQFSNEVDIPMYFDDFYLMDEFTGNSFVGPDFYIACIYPDAAGEYAEFEQATGTPHYTQVNSELIPETNSYVQTSIFNKREAYEHQDILAAAATPVLAVQSCMYQKWSEDDNPFISILRRHAGVNHEEFFSFDVSEEEMTNFRYLHKCWSWIGGYNGTPPTGLDNVLNLNLNQFGMKYAQIA